MRQSHYLKVQLFKGKEKITTRIVDTRFNHVLIAGEYTILLDYQEREREE
jgi:hypothetical protein